MVASGAGGIFDAVYYEAVADSLGTALLALPVEGYRGHTSDAWSLARTRDAADDAHRHLSASVMLGTIRSFRPARITQEAAISFWHRWTGDRAGATTAHARCAAATRAVADMLATWLGPDGIRAYPERTELEPFGEGPDFVLVLVIFTLDLPR